MASTLVCEAFPELIQERMDYAEQVELLPLPCQLLCQAQSEVLTINTSLSDSLRRRRLGETLSIKDEL